MNPRRVAFGFLSLLSCLPLPRAAAQEDSGIAYVAPSIPNDPNLAKAAMLRLIYLPGPDAPSITLAKGDASTAQVMESNIAPENVSPYLFMRPEQLKIHVLDGSVADTPGTPLPLEENNLADPIEARLAPGTYSTLVIRKHNDRLVASMIRDTRPEGSTPTMRVLDLSGLNGWTIRLTDRKAKPGKTLWASGQPASGILLPSPGIRYFEVLRSVDGQPQQVALFETQLGSGTALSIVLSPGPVSTGSANLIFDAAPGDFYDPESLKSLVSGGLQ